MARPGPLTPPQRWALLLQHSLEDAVVRSTAAASSDGREDRDLFDLIAKAASEVERHRDAGAAMRLQFQAMHTSATAWQRPAERGDAQLHLAATGEELRTASGRGSGLDIRR